MRPRPLPCTRGNPAEKDYRNRYAVLMRIVDPANRASALAEKAVAAKELARLRAAYPQADLEARSVETAFSGAQGRRSEEQKKKEVDDFFDKWNQERKEEREEDVDVKAARRAKVRGQRLRHLARVLQEAVDGLAEHTTACLASEFLYFLARVECYAPHEIAAVRGLSDLLDFAVSARTEHGAELGRFAGGLYDFDFLLAQGSRFAYDPDSPIGFDDIPDCTVWLTLVVETATITPWMPAETRRQALQMVEKATALIQTEPEAFLGDSVFSSNRLMYEGTVGLCSTARDFLKMLDTLPFVVLARRVREGLGGGKSQIGKSTTRLTRRT